MRALFSNEFVFGFICLKRIWTGLRAAPLGFGGFAPGHNKIKGLRHLQGAETSAFSTRLAAGSLFLLVAQRFGTQHVNGVLQTDGSNNRLAKDGITYWVNW
jgi:hypothetical protein